MCDMSVQCISYQIEVAFPVLSPRAESTVIVNAAGTRLSEVTIPCPHLHAYRAFTATAAAEMVITKHSP